MVGVGHHVRGWSWGGATWNVGYEYDNPDRGGLTWGNSPQVTQKGLNYYRDLERSREEVPGPLAAAIAKAGGSHD